MTIERINVKHDSFLSSKINNIAIEPNPSGKHEKYKGEKTNKRYTPVKHRYGD
jgi:hypothetical protein